MICCWSAKGGSGTTVVAVALSVLLGRASASGSLLVDLEGDGPTVFGVAQPDGPGLSDWLAATDAVGPSALERLETGAAESVRLLPRGRRPLQSERSDEPRLARCVEHLGNEQRPVIVDAGRLGGTGPDEEVRRAFAESASTSLLVTRACFISLRRTLSLPIRPTGVVLIEEDGRALGRVDVESVLNVPVVASVAVEPSIARAVDAGLLASRLPSPLGRALRDVA